MRTWFWPSEPVPRTATLTFDAMRGVCQRRGISKSGNRHYVGVHASACFPDKLKLELQLQLWTSKVSPCRFFYSSLSPCDEAGTENGFDLQTHACCHCFRHGDPARGSAFIFDRRGVQGGRIARYGLARQRPDARARATFVIHTAGNFQRGKVCTTRFSARRRKPHAGGVCSRNKPLRPFSISEFGLKNPPATPG